MWGGAVKTILLPHAKPDSDNSAHCAYCLAMTSAPSPTPGSLEVPARRWLKFLWIPVAFVLVAVGLWWLGHPRELPLADGTTSATTAAGQPLFLGVEDDDTGREIEVRDVAIDVTEGDDDASVSVWICRGVSVAQTSDPTRFCTDLVQAKGHSLRLGRDQLLVRISATSGQVVHLGRLQLTYSDGWQRATHPIGQEFEVEFLG